MNAETPTAPQHYPFLVLSDLSGHPGYGSEYHTRSYPERTIVYSRHRTRRAAETAKKRYDAHNSYGTYRVVAATKDVPAILYEEYWA